VTADLHLAHISDLLLAYAVFAYAIAMLGYATEFAAGRRAEARGGGEAVVSAGMRRSQSLGRAAVGLTVVGWGLHIAAVTTRGLAVHRVPWGNMYEFSCMVTLVAVTVFLVLLARQRVRFLGAFVMAPVVLYLGLAGTVLYAAPGPLVPALNSYWIKVHVVAAITATGAFMVSGVVTLLYLFKERWERGRPPLRVTLLAGLRSPRRPARVSLGPGTAAAVELRGARGGLMRSLPAAAVLDRLAYRIITFAFPIWTFAIIAGAIWAEQAWSRYWGWDPKETWSFITWLGYAAYLHARATAGWRGRRAATLSLIAFGCLMVDYYVVNTVITGLHSYAGIS
jgi:cytochrome c-type biogenesis protein CcsB